jgi:hypothetical protein
LATDLEKIRLRIKDPYGVLYFETVTTLPTEYDPQTAYIFEERYYIDGEKVLLKVSDDQINEWLALGDINTATIAALQSCKAGLAQELFVVQTDSGADSQKYQDLEKLAKFYDDQIKEYEKLICKKENPTLKKYGKFKKPCFAYEV